MRAVQCRTFNGLKEAVHIEREDGRTYCGCPFTFGSKATLEYSDATPNCGKCLRHYAREIGRMVEFTLCETWGVERVWRDGVGVDA